MVTNRLYKQQNILCKWVDHLDHHALKYWWHDDCCTKNWQCNRTWAKASRQSNELIYSFFFLSFTIHLMMSNAQQTEVSVISTHHVIYGARAGTYFTQYVGPSSISTSQSLSPGGVLIDVESNTICYIGINGQKIPTPLA